MQRVPLPDIHHKRRRARAAGWRLRLSAVLSVGLIAGLVPGVPALAAAPPTALKPANTSVPVGKQAAKTPPTSVTTAHNVRTIGHRTLPAGGSGLVTASGHKVTVGGLGVSLAGKATAAKATAALSAPTASVNVAVQPQAAAAAANLHGVIFTMARADAGTGSAAVDAAFDYSGFADAYGADFGARLRLVRLPACVLTTPSVPACQTPVDVPSRNGAGSVSATLTLPASLPASRSTSAASSTVVAPMVMALVSGASSGNGTYNATDLSEAYSWSAGTQGGTFTTSYPIKVPASNGGPMPDLAVTYDSGIIDAQTISQNAQTSWLGAGWDLQTGYIEQSFRSCSLDGGTTADMCDFSPYNATMMFNGSAVQLVYDGTTWHGSSDTGLKILQLTGATGNKGDNGTYNKEYWEVITPNGTQYYFGANYRYAGDTSTTLSTQYEPVFGNNTGEACHASTFAASVCQQGYRWNLDYVVDTSGNSMTYKYRQDIENVGANNNTHVLPYVVRDNPLEIDYGQRAGSEAASPAPMRVLFNLAERCIDDVTQCAANTTDYPDTPFDLDCKSTTSCPNNETPSFWTRFRLKNIFTELWTGTGTTYRWVDTYGFGYQFPDNGDGTDPQLWLHSIDHNGYAADGTTALSDPQITTDGVRFGNRIDFDAAAGKPELRRWRVDHIYNGSGGDTYINYWGTPCGTADIPTDASQNTKPCFPQTITLPSGTSDHGWFQKRWVSRVTEKDLTGGSPDEEWDYTYSTAGSSTAVLWHIDTGEMVPTASRNWSQFNGYNTVTVTHGATGGPQTVTTSLYYRGMDNDAILSGGAPVWNDRSVQVTDSQGVQYSDDAALQGRLLEQTQPDGAQVLSSTIHYYHETLTATRAKPEATGADVYAYAVNDVSDRTRTWLPTTSTWRWTQSDTSFDGYSLPTDTTGRGDVSTTADDTCTHIDYNRNIAAGITATVSQTLTTDCAVSAAASVAIGTNSFDSITLADMNGDGKKDLVYRTMDSRIWVATNTGGTGMATFAAPVQATWTYWLWEYPNMYFADLTGDGKADIITRDSNGNLFEYTNLGSNTFGARTAIGTGFSTTGYPDIQFADLTGDGRADMQARSGDILYFWKNTGTGTTVTWGTKTQVGSGNWSTYSLISLADVTGDGKADLVARQSDGTLRQFTNMGTSGAGMWSTTQMYTVSGAFTAANAIAFGDMTGDGKLDIVARDTTGTLTVLADTGTLTTAAYTYAAPAATALSGAQTYYDGATALTTTPTKGRPTLTKALAGVAGQTLTWAQSGRTGYDTLGRVVDSWDAIDRNTHTAYTTNTAGQVVTVTVTNPMGWNTVSTIEPGHGSTTSTVDANGKVTTIAYDPLGRTSKVWKNNRSSGLLPDLQYTYTLSNAAPNSVETQTLTPAGAQIASYQIYDGRDRLRQSQTPTPAVAGGRTISDTAYDGRGLTTKTSTFYNSASTPSATLATFADAAVPSQDRFTYDNLERKTVDAFYSLGTQEWASTTAYQGDRISVVPPPGAMPSMSVTDAAGDTIESRQFTTTSLTGTYQATDYTYDRLKRLVKTVDSVGNTWTSVYDPRGWTTSKTDPDSGTATSTYDAAGQVLTSTDARPVTMAYAYDNLGRPVDTYLNTVTGTHLDHWTYDTLAKGQITSNTEYVGGNAYTTSMTGYDDAYHPLGTTVSIPAAEGSALVGPWTTTQSYNVDGSVASATYPAAGALGAETVTYGYDANGFLLTAGGLDTYVSGSQYQTWGDLYQQTLGSGAKRVQVTTDEWADTHRLKSISVGTEHSGTPGTFDEQLTQKFNWNAVGAITSVDSLHGGSVTDSQCYSYDYLQRLTVAFTTTPALGGCAATPSTSTVGGPSAYWQTYTLDATGNRKTLVNHGLGVADTTGTYSYPAAGTAKAHTLSGVTLVGPGGTVNNTYTYGAIGQLTGSTVGGVASTYTLNNQGRLSTMTVGGQTTTYLYDATGNELLRTGPTAKTLYLGATEITSNAAGTSVSGVTRLYTVGGRTVASRNSPGTLSWLASDQQGTSQIAVDQTSLTTTIRREDPFGNARGSVAWPNTHTFIGGTSEPGGLVHLGVRMYDPTTGRFISDDSVTDTSDPQQLNGYAYANNSPVTSSDASGLRNDVQAYGIAGIAQIDGKHDTKPEPPAPCTNDSTCSHDNGTPDGPLYIHLGKSLVVSTDDPSYAKLALAYYGALQAKEFKGLTDSLSGWYFICGAMPGTCPVGLWRLVENAHGFGSTIPPGAIGMVSPLFSSLGDANILRQVTVGDVDSMFERLSGNSYFHYTDAKGYNAAMNADGSATLRANAKNLNFLTQEIYSPSEAFRNVFISNPEYVGKGGYVIVFDLPPGTQFLDVPKQENELIYEGTLRIPAADVLFAGPNPITSTDGIDGVDPAPPVEGGAAP